MVEKFNRVLNRLRYKIALDVYDEGPYGRNKFLITAFFSSSADGI